MIWVQNIFFHYFWGHIIFLVPLLSHFIFFLHVKNQNIFLDKNLWSPQKPTTFGNINKMESFLSYGSRIFFFTIFEAVLFF